MKRTVFLILPIIVATFFLSGCSLPGGVVPTKISMANATFIKTEDGGTSWNPKMKIDEKKTLAGVDVLSVAIDPFDSSIVYIGTMANGLFVSKNAGESWTQVPFADKAYGLIFDQNNQNIMYGSGVLNDRGKIYKRLAEDQEWKEVYTEPSDGTIISSLAISKFNSQILYAGTSEGVIIKTIDGGQTWVNLKTDPNFKGPITSIGFDAANENHVFFAVFQVGVLETKNAGVTIENITEKVDTIGQTSSVYSLVADPYLGGVVYVGTGGGIFRRNGSDGWSSMNIIESSKAFPIRSIAVNPKNSKEIMYSSAKAVYKSVDSGARWSTFQLDTSKEISVIKYDVMDPIKMYAGLRSF